MLEERYQTYFTKGGKPRTGKQAAPLLALEAEHENYLAERKQRIEQQQRFEETGRAVEDARQKRGQTRLEADALRETVVQTRQQTETYQRLQDELAQKRQTEQAAKERFEAIGQSLELIGSGTGGACGYDAHNLPNSGIETVGDRRILSFTKSLELNRSRPKD